MPSFVHPFLICVRLQTRTFHCHIFAQLAGRFHESTVVVVHVGVFHGCLEGVGPQTDRVLLLVQGGGAGVATQHRDGVLYIQKSTQWNSINNLDSKVKVVQFSGHCYEKKKPSQNTLGIQ